MAEIRNCPNPECGCYCTLQNTGGGFSQVWCGAAHAGDDNGCDYRGPEALGNSEAVRLHNLIASRVPTDKLKQLEAKLRQQGNSDALPLGGAIGYIEAANDIASLIKEGGK